MSISLSVIMMTKNGEGRISRSLANLSGIYDQLVVCIDDNTTDDSFNEAKRLTDDVHLFTFEHWGQAKDNMLQYVKCDWVFLLDDDEDLTNEDAANLKAACETDHDMLIVPRYHWLDFERTKRDERRPYPDGQHRLHKNVPYIRCGMQFAHASPRGSKNPGWISHGIHINHYNAIYCDRQEFEKRTAMYNELYLKYAGISYQEYLDQYIKTGRGADAFYADLKKKGGGKNE